VLTDVVGAGHTQEVAAWALARGRATLEAREKIVTRIVRGGDDPAAARGRPADAYEGTLTLVDPRSAAPLDPPPAVATARPAPARQAHASTRARIAALVLGAASVTGLALVLRGAPRGLDATEPPAAEPPAATIPAVTAAAPVASFPPAPAEPASEPSAAAPSATAVITAPATSQRTAGPRRPPSAPTRRHEKEPAPKNGDCSPPYSIDEQGGKHFKSWCLR
jgi:serine/threonine-protein kinase